MYIKHVDIHDIISILNNMTTYIYNLISIPKPNAQTKQKLRYVLKIIFF